MKNPCGLYVTARFSLHALMEMKLRKRTGKWAREKFVLRANARFRNRTHQAPSAAQAVPGSTTFA